MISILKETDACLIEKACADYGAVSDESTVIYAAKERGNLLGYIVFSDLGDQLILYRIVSDAELRDFLDDGLFRAALNYGAERGIMTAELSDEVFEMLKERVIPEEFAVKKIDDIEVFLAETKKCARTK